jgi:hypothetical protein
MLEGDDDVRLSRYHVLTAIAAVPLVLAACGGGGGNGSGTAAAGVTPTATASIEIIGTPAPAGGSTVTTSSGNAASSTALTISASAGSTSGSATAATSSAAGSTYTVTGTGGSNLVLRQAPNGTKIGDVPAGGVVTSLGEPTQQAGSYTWMHVKMANGQQGWVATKFLSGGAAAPTATPLPGGQQ